MVKPLRCNTGSMVRTAGERADVQGLQLGEDGLGPDQAVARGRRGMGLEPPADGEDGPLQLGRDAPGTVVGPGQVVEPLDAGLEVAAPPLVEPDQGSTDGEQMDLTVRPARRRVMAR